MSSGNIHIGCAESDGIRYLARRIRAVQARYPGIRAHLYSEDTDDLAERLDRGLLDFAVIAEAVDLSRYNYLELPGRIYGARSCVRTTPWRKKNQPR